MIQMEISLDENKIEQEGIYEPAEIKKQIDSLFEAYHLAKVSEGVYVGTGNKDDFAHFGSTILHLKKQDWFILYVNKWMWNIDGTVEDIADHYRRKPYLA